MTNANDARKAHKLLDYVSQGRAVLDDEIKLLRSFLPDLPKQKTLEEITEHVRDAWIGASGNEWASNSYNTEIALESWLGELYVQLKGLIDTPVAVPALPAGMRLADHWNYGRVVVSPVTDGDGDRMIFCLDNTALGGAGRRWAHENSLTFIHDEPFAPAHPEFLETEADYETAPLGTIAIHGDGYPWTRIFGSWVAYSRNEYSPSEMAALRGKARVLRWGRDK